MTPTSIIRRKKTPKPTPESLFVTTFAGLEEILAKEIETIGGKEISIATRGVEFKGDLETVYKANLWLRTAHRVLWLIAKFPSANRDELYAGVRAISWDGHLDTNKTLAVDTVGVNDNLSHTQFSSRVVKDGIVDWFRDNTGNRPSVDVKNPDIKLNARIVKNECYLSIDTSGERLNKRGYRSSYSGTAPLKENLAAGLVYMSGFDGKGQLIDPMCGSGTILIEAAMIAKNIAPGILGRTFSFTSHPGFNSRLWANLQEDARNEIIEVEGCPIIGFDIAHEAVRIACTAVLEAGVDDIVRINQKPLVDLPSFDAGKIVTNPPYGERLGEINQLADLYELLGSSFKHKCKGMTAHVITGSKFLAGKIGLKTKRRDTIWNGSLECRFLNYDLY